MIYIIKFLVVLIIFHLLAAITMIIIFVNSNMDTKTYNGLVIEKKRDENNYMVIVKIEMEINGDKLVNIDIGKKEFSKIKMFDKKPIIYYPKKDKYVLGIHRK